MWKIDLSCGGKVGITFAVITLIVCLSAMMLYAIVAYGRAIVRGQARGSARYAVGAFVAVGSVLGALLWVVVGVVSDDLCDVVIEEDGTWLLKNPLGSTFDRIPGGMVRTVDFQSGQLATYSRGARRYYPYTWFTVRTEDGQDRSFETVDGDKLLDRLGYDPALCPLTLNPDGTARIVAHRFGPWGPICGTAPPPYSPGQAIFGEWESDGWWYPTVVSAVESGRVQVTWSDGSTTWISPAQIAPSQIPDGWTVQAKWGDQGLYYDCTVDAREADVLRITWAADRSAATARLADLRLRPVGGGAT